MILASIQTLVEDMDGDNKPDIVASHYQGFSVFQNVNQGGDITDESFIRNTQNDPDLSSADLYVADIDGNGLKDIIGQYQIRATDIPQSLRTRLYFFRSSGGFTYQWIYTGFHSQ